MLEIVKSFLDAVPPLPQWLQDPPQAGEVTGRYYKRTGGCNQCGKCCSNIYLVHGDETITSTEQFEALKPFNPEYAYFKPVEENEHGVLFACIHLQADNSCGIYEDRPLFCRRYPSEMSLLMGGKLADGCGYAFEPLIHFKDVLSQAMQTAPNAPLQTPAD